LADLFELYSIFIGGVFPTSGIHPKEGLQHSEHGASLKSRTVFLYGIN